MEAVFDSVHIRTNNILERKLFGKSYACYQEIDQFGLYLF